MASRTQDAPSPRAASLQSSLATEPRRIYELGQALAENVRSDALLRRVLLGLLAVDVIFIVANLAARALSLSPKLQAAVGVDLGFVLTPALSVNADQGLPEMTNYLKTAGAALLLYLCGRQHRQPIYIVGGVAFLIILVDDALMIHESVGGWLAAQGHLPFAFGLRPQDFGELAVYAVWMAVVGALGLYGLAASSAVHIRAAMLFVAVIGLISFFSVLVDMAEIAVHWQFRRVALMIGVLEDGGEMIGMTIALVVALALWRHPELVTEKPALTAR